MTSNKGQIKHAQILVAPSAKLQNFIKDLKVVDEDIPAGIQGILYKNKPAVKETPGSAKQLRPEYLLNEADRQFIQDLNLPSGSSDFPLNTTSPKTPTCTLTLPDLLWLYNYLRHHKDDVYLHELLEGSEILLPKNEEIPRNQELELRCQKLKVEQQNREYHDMTKNVDGLRRKLPEDTIGFQLKMMNSHLIAVFQFIVSVLTGFAFGFIGIELLVGTLDFGFRLLLGIAAALIVAIAELYFLAKKLNEDLEFENSVKKPKFKDEEKKVK